MESISMPDLVAGIIFGTLFGYMLSLLCLQIDFERMRKCENCKKRLTP